MTLVEVLVAIFLLAIVGTIIAGIVIAGLKLTRTTTSGVAGQSEVNDAVARITRDIAAADPILWTAPETGWPKSTPAVDDLWLQTVTDSKCVRTRYWVDTSGSKKTLSATTQSYASNACPDPRSPDTTTPSVTKDIVKDLKYTTGTKIFTYYDKSNNEITAPVSRISVPKIARVKIDVASNVVNRGNGVRLVTSVAPRSIDNPLITNVPPPNCAQANLRATNNGLTPSSPVISWDSTDDTDLFTLRRVTPRPYTFPTVTTNPYTITDTAMRGRWGAPIVYELDMSGPGGDVTCSLATPYLPNNPAPLNPPVINVVLNPNTSTTPQSITTPTVNITWSAIPRATHYNVMRRSIDPNGAAHAATSVYARLGGDPTTTGLSFTQNLPFDEGYEYVVVAVSTEYEEIPTGNYLSSAPSNSGKVVTHNAAISLTANPLTYRQNRITWTKDTGSTVDGYTLWRKPNGTSAASWAPIWSTSDVNLLSYTDSAALDTRFDYQITSYNNGPRGTGSLAGELRYYGNTSNLRTVLQYPAIPNAYARGTENGYNPDGRNSVHWSPVPTATSYQIWEYNSVAAARVNPTNTWTYYGVGNVTNYYDENGANGAAHNRGSRNFYAVIAQNATGFSENHNVPGVGGDLRAANLAVAYQRPPTPSASVYRSPQLNDLYSETSFSGTGDAGEGGNDNFCGRASAGTANEGGCYYDIHAYHNTPADGTGNDRNWVYGGGYDAMGFGYNSSNWGTRDYLYFNACNAGGCSDWTAVYVDAYPGDFQPVWNDKATDGTRLNWVTDSVYFNSATGASSADNQQPSSYADWNVSIGASSYLVNWAPYANQPWHREETYWRDANTRYMDTRRLDPGASYYANVTAYAPNGLSRLSQGRLSVQPANAGAFQTTQGCKRTVTRPNGNAGPWKPGRRWATGVIASPDNNGNGVRGPWYDEWAWTYIDHIRSSEAVGRPSNAANSQMWYDMVNEAEANYFAIGNNSGGGGWLAWQNWQAHFNNGGRLYYWTVWGDARRDVFSMNERSGPMVAGSWSDDGLYVTPDAYFGGVVKLESQNANAWNAQRGRYNSDAVVLIEFAGSGGVGCPADGVAGWKNNPGSTSMRSHLPWWQDTRNPNSPQDSWRVHG